MPSTGSPRTTAPTYASPLQVTGAGDRFFALSLDLLCIAGLDGYFKAVNPAFTQTVGYTREELLAVPFVEFVHPDDREATAAVLAELAAGQPTVFFQNRYRCKDGSYR